MGENRKLSRFELDNQDSVWIEIEDIPIDNRGDVSAGDIQRTARERVEHERRFQEAVERIRPAATAVFSALKELNTPKQIELEFGIGFSGKVGAFIASADSSATFKVKLIWENEATTPASAP